MLELIVFTLDSARIDEDLEILGSEYVLERDVSGDVNLVEGKLVIPVGREVSGDINCTSGEIEVYGSVLGNINSMLCNIHIYGKVAKDVNALGGNIVIHEEALVQGNIHGLLVSFENKGKVEGDVELFPKSKFLSIPDLKLPEMDFFKDIFILILSFLTFIIAKSWIVKLSEETREQFLRNLVFGILLALLVVPFLIFLVLTLIGIFLIPIYVVLIVLIYLVSFVAGLFMVGNLVSDNFNLELGELQRFLIGMLVYIVISALVYMMDFVDIGWVAYVLHVFKFVFVAILVLAVSGKLFRKFLAKINV